MTINFSQQILCRLNKAQELHKTTPIHLSAFIPWSCIESYHPVFLKVYFIALPSTSSPNILHLTFLAVLSPGFKLPTLFSNQILSFFLCMPLIWGSGSSEKLGTGRPERIQSVYLVARTWQEGASWVCERFVLLSLKVITKGWTSQSIRDADLQQRAFKQVGYYGYFSYNIYRQGEV